MFVPPPGVVLFHCVFVDVLGCTYDWPIYAADRSEALEVIWDYFLESETIYLRVVAV